jgi:S-adenosylhomocysteine hydrolase
MAAKNYDVKDKKLAKEGKKRIDWAARDMPVLELVAKLAERLSNLWKALEANFGCLSEARNAGRILRSGS